MLLLSFNKINKNIL